MLVFSCPAKVMKNNKTNGKNNADFIHTYFIFLTVSVFDFIIISINLIFVSLVPRK